MIPDISVIVVARNESTHIADCIMSLLAQDYPADKYELIIVDSMSDDDTQSIARETHMAYLRQLDCHQSPVKVSFLENQKINLASGWNAAIRASRGQYVIRLDAHAQAYPNLLSSSLEAILSKPDCACVGGTIQTISTSTKGRLIASVLSSPFGVGNSKFRYTSTGQYVDTVAFGLYRKIVFDQIGYFDETLERNQDNDLHSRLRKAGWKFYLIPEVLSMYHSRSTIRALMKQGFGNGKWGIIVSRRTPGAMAIRHLVPMFFLLTLLTCVVTGCFTYWGWIAFGLILLAYCSVGLVANIMSNRVSDSLRMLPIALLFHCAYGIGSLTGVFNPFQ